MLLVSFYLIFSLLLLLSCRTHQKLFVYPLDLTIRCEFWFYNLYLELYRQNEISFSSSFVCHSFDTYMDNSMNSLKDISFTLYIGLEVFVLAKRFRQILWIYPFQNYKFFLYLEWLAHSLSEICLFVVAFGDMQKGSISMQSTPCPLLILLSLILHWYFTVFLISKK